MAQTDQLLQPECQKSYSMFRICRAPGSLEQVVRLPVGSLIERVVKHVTLPVEVSFHLRKHDPIRTPVMNCRKSCQLPGLICSHGLHSSDQSPHRAGAEAVGESPSLLAAAEFSLHCGAAKIQFSRHPVVQQVHFPTTTSSVPEWASFKLLFKKKN